MKTLKKVILFTHGHNKLHIGLMGRQNSPQYDDKNMLGNIGYLFVKCMQQVTKGHLYYLLGVSDYYVMYSTGPRQFYEMLAKITNWVTDPLGWFCNILWKVCG